MIKVTFTESGKKLSLRVEGHAEYAEHGKDIVCASATILAYTVAQYIREHKSEFESIEEVRLDIGDTYISCEPNEELWHEMQNAFMFAKIGFAVLEHNFPQYVRLMES